MCSVGFKFWEMAFIPKRCFCESLAWLHYLARTASFVEDSLSDVVIDDQAGIGEFSMDGSAHAGDVIDHATTHTQIPFRKEDCFWHRSIWLALTCFYLPHFPSFISWVHLPGYRISFSLRNLAIVPWLRAAYIQNFYWSLISKLFLSEFVERPSFEYIQFFFYFFVFRF